MRGLAVIATALALGAAPALAQEAKQEKAEQPAQQGQAQQPRQAQLGADAHHLIGKKAVSAQGKDMGKIKDVLVGQDGKVQALVVDYKNKNRAVPWDEVKLQGDQVSLSISEQELAQSPEYKGAGKD